MPSGRSQTPCAASYDRRIAGTRVGPGRMTGRYSGKEPGAPVPCAVGRGRETDRRGAPTLEAADLVGRDDRVSECEAVGLDLSALSLAVPVCRGGAGARQLAIARDGVARPIDHVRARSAGDRVPGAVAVGGDRVVAGPPLTWSALPSDQQVASRQPQSRRSRAAVDRLQRPDETVGTVRPRHLGRERAVGSRHERRCQRDGKPEAHRRHGRNGPAKLARSRRIEESLSRLSLLLPDPRSGRSVPDPQPPGSCLSPRR
jgi:hypothetical protein